MKNLKTFLSGKSGKTLMTLFLLFASGCSDPSRGVLPSPDLVSNPDGDWVALLDDLYYDAGIIVQKGNSIQDAVNAAKPGEAIYIEPGTYRETITIDKPEIKIIGLNDNDVRVVIEDNTGLTAQSGLIGNITVTEKGRDVEIINVQYKNSAEKSLRREPAQVRKRKTSSFKVTRHEIGSRIAHYEFEVRVGHRPFDVVRLHRVVRENKPFVPVRTRGAVFMLHGASLTFDAIFVQAGATSPGPETSAALYLASKNVDVWGMDFAWTLVPAETTDFSFMQDWGVERDVDHTLAAMSVARLIRGITWQGFGRMNLLGFSYGVSVAYAAAGRESQQHRILRDVKGIVAVDQAVKYDTPDESGRMAACITAAQTKQQIDNGVFRSNNGQVFAGFSGLATTSPDGASPFVPGLSNYQAALFIGTSTFAQGNPAAPFWHFVGGQFDDLAVPVPSGLLYSDPSRWLRLMASLPPYQPQKTTYDVRACLCNEEDVTIDDHLGEIEVPILYIGAEGAFGTLGEYTSSLTASHDLTNYTVSLKPPSQRIIDFGHGDLFLANDAPNLVWAPLQQWLVNHNFL